MTFDISDLPDPENRTAQQWVTFCLRVENAVSMGQSVTLPNGQSITHQNIATIVKLRKEWEGRAAAAAKPSGPSPYAPIYIG